MNIVTEEDDSNCLTLESYAGRQLIPVDSIYEVIFVDVTL